MKAIFLVVFFFGLVGNASSESVERKYENLLRVGNKAEVEVTKEPTPLNQCRNKVIAFEKYQKPIMFHIEESFLNKNPSDFTKAFTKEMSVSSFTQFQAPATTELNDGIKLTRYEQFKNLQSKKDIESDLKDYFKDFKKIEKFEWDAFEVGVLDGKNELSVFFMVKGIKTDGTRRQDSGIFKLGLAKIGDKWMAQNLKMEKMNTLVKTTPSHYKLSSALETKTYQRLEAIRRGGYAIAVGDYNNDGNQDLLVGAYGPMEIFKGDGKGNFKKDEATKIPPFTLVKSAAWADFDNDGDQDLILVRFIPDDPEQVTDENQSFKLSRVASSVLIYENEGKGTFKSIPQKLNKENYIFERAMPVAIGDFNRDGLLDAYVGFPGVKDFTALTPADDARKYGHKAQAIFLNKGGLKFESENMSNYNDFEIFSKGNVLYPHSAVAADVDQDGVQDISVIDDRGNISPIYHNNGSGKFEEKSKEFGIQNRGWGMALAAGDLNNDGAIDLGISIVSDNANTQMRKCMNWPVEKGLSMFINSGGPAGKPRKFARYELGDLDFVGQGLGGIEFVDYDQDGLMDLYVTNGLWSGDDKKADDLTGVIVRALNDEAPEALEESANHTRSYVMDVLARYKDKNGKHLSMAGFQSNRLYKNIGKTQFVDVAYLEGIDSIHDGYVVAKADFNNDGVQDIVLRNADPGIKNIKNPPVELFMGEKQDKNSLILNFVGSKSNRDGVGAEVEVIASGIPKQTQQLIANNGCAQSQKALFFALGKNKEAEAVKVRWPSGKVEVIQNMKAGVHTLQEGVSRITSI